MGEIGSIAYWLLIFSALVLVAAILTPLIEKVLLNFDYRLTTAGDKDRVRKIAQLGQLFTQPNRSPDKYRDPHLDELILAGRLDEARQLVAERLRLAWSAAG